MAGVTGDFVALDRNKVLQAAQKHLAKGNYDKAIAEYRRLVEDDPRDVRTWLKIGDLYTRKGARREASDTYGKVAEYYAKEGFFLKAVAVYKQILKLDPSRLDIHLKLAEMYEQLQLVSDALATYEAVAVTLMKSGDIDRGLAALTKMCAIDPENIPVRIKVAEALSKAGRTEAAAREFEAGASLLRAQGRMDDYLKVAERLLFHRPNDVSLARELAEQYLERDDAKRALAKLQICFKANPRDVLTLELLARAFHQLGQTPKTISVYREAARIYHDGKRPADRERILRLILELDPSDAEAAKALAELGGGAGRAVEPRGVPAAAVVHSPSEPPPGSVVSAVSAAPTPPPEAPSLEVEEEDEVLLVAAEDEEVLLVAAEDEEVEELEVEEDIDVEVEDEEVEEATAAAAPAMGAPSQPSIPPEVALEAQVARLITECEVFERYGLRDKVIAQLERVLELAPDNVEARRKLKGHYLAASRPDDAVQMLLDVALLVRANDPAEAKACWEEALRIDPENIDARTALRALQPTAMEAAFEAETGSVRSELIEDEEVPESGDILFVEEPEVGPADAAEPAGAQGFREPITGEVDTGMILEEAESIPPPAPAARVSSLPPPARISTIPPAARVSSVPPAARVSSMPPTGEPELPPGLAPMSVAEFEAAPLRELSPAERKAAVDQRLAAGPSEVEECLDEVDFYLAQGMYEEAIDTLEDALASRPGHLVLTDKLEEVRELAAAEEAGEALPTDDASFALAEKLAEEIEEAGPIEEVGQAVLDVETVFAQFKKGVEEQIGAEDTETHFDLGIAYKEMGLLPDAIHEFELAMKSPARECMCRTMMGMCHVQNGNVDAAIEQFQLGLAVPRKTDREELGLHFELGCAYEGKGAFAEALEHYMEVKEGDPTFRGIDERIAACQSPGSVPPPPLPDDSDDIDDLFDDLMSD